MTADHSNFSINVFCMIDFYVCFVLRMLRMNKRDISRKLTQVFNRSIVLFSS